jgi:hypothetical protein
VCLIIAISSSLGTNANLLPICTSRLIIYISAKSPDNPHLSRDKTSQINENIIEQRLWLLFATALILTVDAQRFSAGYMDKCMLIIL